MLYSTYEPSITTWYLPIQWNYAAHNMQGSGYLHPFPQGPQINTNSIPLSPMYQHPYHPGLNTEYSGSPGQNTEAGRRHDGSAEYGEERSGYPDFIIVVLLIVIWSCLIASCAVLLFMTGSATRADSNMGELLTVDEIAYIIALSTVPLLVATVLNEVFVERCWRRAQYYALGRNLCGKRVENFDGAQMAVHLRAATFTCWRFLIRTVKGKSGIRDWLSFLSWLWLRSMTTVAIASTQLCISWQTNRALVEDQEQPLYSARRRRFFIVIPVLIHCIAAFGTSTIWLKLPWTLLSGRYRDRGFMKIYEHYLRKVDGGTIADCDEVADYFEGSRSNLAKPNRPGVQFCAKITGLWFGILSMFVPPSLILWYTMHQPADRSSVLRSDLFRFSFHMVFLTQNILYIVALDFAMWNVSLEFLCKTSSSTGDPAPPLKSSRHLRYLDRSAGLTLFYKAFLQVWSSLRRGRPLRPVVFTCLFYLQACAMRLSVFLWIFGVQVLSYGSINYRRTLFYPNFWYGWLVVSGAITLPLFAAWLFWPCQAPVCDQDGWRWAQIVRSTYSEPQRTERGYYGVAKGSNREGREFYYATWGPHVESFESAKGKKLM